MAKNRENNGTEEIGLVIPTAEFIFIKCGHRCWHLSFRPRLSSKKVNHFWALYLASNVQCMHANHWVFVNFTGKTSLWSVTCYLVTNCLFLSKFICKIPMSHYYRCGIHDISLPKPHIRTTLYARSHNASCQIRQKNVCVSQHVVTFRN